MKILVITNMYPDKKMPFYGIFVKEQVDSLKKLGIHVDVFYIRGKENKLSYFSCLLTLIKQLKKHEYDIIHVHHTYCIYPLLIAKKIIRKNITTILTFHEGEVHQKNIKNIKRLSFLKQLVFSKKLKTFALKNTDLVICVQEEMMKQLDYNGKYIILPCGVDLELFKPMNKNKCKEKLNINKSQKIIFFPANPENTQKGYDVLVNAINLTNRNDIELLCGGNITHESMPLYMNAADVIVQLSEFEASPSVLKEAMAVNAVAIFSDAGDSKDVIGNTYGYFIARRTSQDVSKKLIEAIDLKSQSKGRKRIEDLNLSLKKVSISILKIYQLMSKLKEVNKKSIHIA